tara:strand:+ start:1996 stop:3018 length:1023 start_codon:yes stop_codon:yes gene_type:complete
MRFLMIALIIIIIFLIGFYFLYNRKLIKAKKIKNVESFTDKPNIKKEKNYEPNSNRLIKYDKSLFKGKIRLKDTVNKIYDKFYAKVYSQLVHQQMFNKRIKFEVNNLVKNTNLQNYKNGVVVDLGCGVGSHLQLLSMKNLDIRLVGVDQSEEMLKLAKINIGKNNLTPVRLLQDDITNKDLFARSSITHITLYYFTIYYLKDIDNALTCWNYWLKPNGYLIVHLVDPKRFDPVLDASAPFVGHSLQAYSKSRRTESTVHFTNFLYRSFFDYNSKNNSAQFEEHFEFDEHPNRRINTHVLKMFTADDFVSKCKKKKMKLHDTVHLIKYGYAYEYLLYFRKE